MSAVAVLEAPVAFDPGAHVRLAFRVANRFRRRAVAAGLEVEDLAGHALLALVKKARRYTPERGAPSTFAAMTMRYAIISLLKHHRPLNGLPADAGGRELPLAAPPERDRHAEAELVGRLLDELPARERAVAAEFFGLGDGRARRLEDLGEEMGVSKSRIGQLLDRALGRMRAAAAERGLVGAG